MPIKWPNGNPVEVVKRNLILFRKRLYDEVNNEAGQLSTEIEDWMKVNAIWKDRTGNARRSLYAEVHRVALQTTILLGYENIPYDVWLEFAHSGTYSIIAPAIDRFAPEFYGRMQGVVNRVGRFDSW